jgi:ribosome recycling factor
MGDHILVKIPPLTQERRKEISKQVSAFGEDIKVRLRGVRHDAMKAIKKLEEEKELSEDQQKTLSNNVDELTKDMTIKVEQYVKHKQTEVMGE